MGKLKSVGVEDHVNEYRWCSYVYEGSIELGYRRKLGSKVLNPRRKKL